MNEKGSIRMSLNVFWAMMGFAVLIGVAAQQGQAQSTAVTLFDLAGGVRALGMGEAFVAVADDEEALFYNPAGLAYQKRLGVSAFYESRFVSSHYLNASFALPRWSAGLSVFSFGGVEQRDDQDTVKGAFNYSSYALMGAAGLSLSDLPLAATKGMSALALGLRVKSLFISTLDPGNGFGLGMDPSLMLSLTNLNLGGFRVEALRTGLFLENLVSTGTSYSGRSEPWPLKLRLGTALLLKDVAVGLDIGVPFQFHLGSEVRLQLPELGELAIRLGGIIEHDAFSLTLGLGIQVQDFQFDYAFISHPQLPGSHRLALSWRL